MCDKIQICTKFAQNATAQKHWNDLTKTSDSVLVDGQSAKSVKAEVLGVSSKTYTPDYRPSGTPLLPATSQKNRLQAYRLSVAFATSTSGVVISCIASIIEAITPLQMWHLLTRVATLNTEVIRLPKIPTKVLALPFVDRRIVSFVE